MHRHLCVHIHVLLYSKYALAEGLRHMLNFRTYNQNRQQCFLLWSTLMHLKAPFRHIVRILSVRLWVILRCYSFRSAWKDLSFPCNWRGTPTWEYKAHLWEFVRQWFGHLFKICTPLFETQCKSLAHSSRSLKWGRTLSTKDTLPVGGYKDALRFLPIWKVLNLSNHGPCRRSHFLFQF